MSLLRDARLLTSLVVVAILVAAGSLPGLTFAIDNGPDFSE